MAMGTKQGRQKQEELFYANERIETPGHRFYEQLNRRPPQLPVIELAAALLAKHVKFRLLQHSLAPGVYFRLLLIGLFEGIASERGIAGGWRTASAYGGF
jgi:hypothetical protein